MVRYVKEWLEKYPSIKRFEKLTKRGRIVPRTLEGYVEHVKQFCDLMGYSDPETALAQIKQIEDKEGFLDDAVSEMRKGTSDTRVTYIMKGVKWWLRLNNVEVDWREIILPRVETQIEDRAPTKDELKRILNLCNLRDKALILTAISSGLRANTLRTLTFGDVNFDYPDVARIMVKRQYEIGDKTFTEGRKISAQRKFYVTFISPEAKRMLLEYKQHREEQGEEITDKSPLFTSIKRAEQGQFFSKEYITIHWGRLLKRAHLDMKSGDWFVLHFHTLKKYAETQFINAGVTPSYREFWLGHKGAYLEASYFRGEEQKHLEEYRKAIPELSILEVPKPSEYAVMKAEIQTRLENMPIEMRRDFLKHALENLKLSTRLALEEDAEITELLRKSELRAPHLDHEMKASKRIKAGNEDCQRLIEETELESYLGKGWRYVATLSNGKIVIEK